jgi:hypothetical protein
MANEKGAQHGSLFNRCRKEVSLMRRKRRRSQYAGIAMLIVAVAKAIAIIIAACHR